METFSSDRERERKMANLQSYRTATTEQITRRYTNPETCKQ